VGGGGGVGGLYTLKPPGEVLKHILFNHKQVVFNKKCMFYLYKCVFRFTHSKLESL